MDHEPLQLPVVRLAPLDELAQAARDSRRLRSVRRLAEWIGPSRKITKIGDLTLADARNAVRDLMLPGDQGPGRTPARSAPDFTELQALWELATHAELVLADDGVAQPGPALADLRGDDDEDVVGVWVDLLDETLEQTFWSEELSRGLVPALMVLYVSPDPVPLRELAIASTAAEHDLDAQAVAASDRFTDHVDAAGIAVEDLVEQLVELGAAVADGGAAGLTPLGSYGVNYWLDTVGVAAPAVTDLADASAAELIELGYTASGPDELDALFSQWTAARGAANAAYELVGYAGTGGPGERMTAFSLLDRIGPPAEQAVRHGMDVTTTRPHARAWLSNRGLADAELELADVQWLFVDAVLATSDADAGELQVAISRLGQDEPQTAELLGELWRCGHPQTAEALEALAVYPHEAVATVARKAALQARSAAAPPAKRRTGSMATTKKSAKARAKAKTTEAKAAWEASACQLKITLVDVKPPMWRRITVPASITLPQLHAAIQTAMGWTDSHLHEFDIGADRYGEPDPDWPPDMLPEAGIRLLDKVGEGGRIRYVYDFGDDWRHDVLIEKVLPVGAEVPVCLAGRRACPPEDVGGPWGYADFLDAYDDPAHPRHDEMRDWAGARFDPERFDAAEVTADLKRLFR
ncbi:MAG TPA: plasmid pRiA4b ORF-3 family protein [Jatrophihabitantaceae bacterium]|nr:plasmid pRiA4b ORF-3 family protein [Jatrophihabitantaceae bacterium]